MAEIGGVVIMDIARTEGDTNDIVVLLKNDDGTPADVDGWTAVLSIGTDDDTPLAPPKTYPGVGGANGLVSIDMDGFDVPPESYKYDIRIRDTDAADQPFRVYFKGKFKVGKRIN